MGSPHWEEKEIRRLKKLFRSGKTDEEIAKAVGRPETGVKGKRVSMGLHRRKRRRSKGNGSVAATSRVTTGNGVQHDEEHPYAVIIRGPHRELAMAVDRDTGNAILQLMLGVDG
jgi:hypothetical protein